MLQHRVLIALLVFTVLSQIDFPPFGPATFDVAQQLRRLGYLLSDFIKCYNKTMAAIDWTNICKKYKGLWIGLKDDEETVVSSGKSIDEVMKKAKQKGYLQPILFRVPTKIIPYIGTFL